MGEGYTRKMIKIIEQKVTLASLRYAHIDTFQGNADTLSVTSIQGMMQQVVVWKGEEKPDHLRPTCQTEDLDSFLQKDFPQLRSKCLF